ncbi:Beta-xylosidase [Pontiella desulfatans]|uniref:Beta-xylosidase n=1 Tax=Pontiella desulfatans TaxID=2750659 RepID=A0A6C2TWP7_PONDE|nr:beta-xylosidase [Pontiella desulfatans]VGO11736.1 Beta-xylosidase [Pontiella desulfatans]
MNTKITISADAQGEAVKTFRPHWSPCVGAGRANEALRCGWMEQMELVHRECGFESVRFHGLFHNDMFVYRRNADGSSTFNFQYVDEIFDRLLDLGVRPFIELGFCPEDLARPSETVFWWKGNSAPPTDYDAWGELVRRFTEHVVARYGIDEVLNWYFEVWNEPNLEPFWHGTKSEYFRLYQVSAEVIKAIDPRLKVGGPSTSNFVPDARFDGETEDLSEHKSVTCGGDLDALDWKPVWLDDFLAFCVEHQLPVDFISVHPYPTDWAFDEHGTGQKLTRGVDATPKDLQLLRETMDASAFPNAEIHLTEWNCSSSSRDFTHDYLQAATYVAKANVESIGFVDSLSFWTFTDVFEESGAGDTAFHGGFGMVNFQGIPKPTFHAYRLLNTLGGEVLERTANGLVTRNRETGRIAVLAYHYPPEVTRTIPGSYENRDVAEATLATGSPVDVVIELSGLAPGAEFVLELVGQEHGDSLAAWKKMGAPDPLSREQAKKLKEAARATKMETSFANEDGILHVFMTLEPWNLLSLRHK